MLTRRLQRRPRSRQQSHLAEFRCLAFRRQPVLMACLRRLCRPAGCHQGCLRSVLGPMGGWEGLQRDRREDPEVAEVEEVSEDLLEVEVVLAVIQGVADGCLQLAARPRRRLRLPARHRQGPTSSTEEPRLAWRRCWRN